MQAPPSAPSVHAESRSQFLYLPTEAISLDNVIVRKILLPIVKMLKTTLLRTMHVYTILKPSHLLHLSSILVPVDRGAVELLLSVTVRGCQSTFGLSLTLSSWGGARSQVVGHRLALAQKFFDL